MSDPPATVANVTNVQDRPEIEGWAAALDVSAFLDDAVAELAGILSPHEQGWVYTRELIGAKLRDLFDESSPALLKLADSRVKPLRRAARRYLEGRADFQREAIAEEQARLGRAPPEDAGARELHRRLLQARAAAREGARPRP